MELNGPQKTPAKSLWHVVRAVYYMVLKGLWKRSAALDLQLIFKRGKIAGGRALSGLLTAHHHHHHRHGKTAAFDVAAFSSAFSCRSMDTANAVYAPREVEFSCSNTPSFPYFHRKGRHQHHHHHHNHHHHRSSSSSRSSSSRRDSTLYNYDAAAIAKVFDVLNSDSSASTSTSGASVDVVAASFARSPRRARQPLRVTDSPFSTAEEDDDDDDDYLEVGGGGGGVDREAENFIRWFKEQLRTQTPESEYGDHWL